MWTRMNQALTVMKALADDTRRKIIIALSERDMYVELLAERLQLSPATVSFHLKKLLAAGIVDARKEQYYTIYSLRGETFNMKLKDIYFGGSGHEDDAAAAHREELYRRKVLKSFMPDGYCHQLPVQLKKRMIVFEEIYRLFEPGRDYPEREVNETIMKIHGDFCSVRRAFVSLGWMSRERGIYKLIGDGVTPPADEDILEPGIL